VKAYQDTILDYQAAHAKRQLVLAGFSGGGSLAAQIAIQLRQDHASSTICLITIASPLDLNAWAKYHRLSFFKDVVDVDLLKQTLLDMPAAFAFGDADRKVPIESAGVFLRDPRLVDKVHRYIDLKHNEDWVDHWPELLRKAC
jgi:thioesterase domain-containing protein